MLAEVVTGLVGAFVGFHVGWWASLALDAVFSTEADWIRQLNAGIVFGGIALGVSGGVMLGGALSSVEGNLPLCQIGGGGVGVQPSGHSPWTRWVKPRRDE